MWQHLAQGFCDFYSQVGPKLASRLGKEREGAYLEYMGRQVEESLIWRPTNPDDVEKLCGALDARKAAAWDGVSPMVVKGVTCELARSLSCLFNCCMRDEHYPARFKVARMVPIFKGKGEDPTDYAGYHPVSVIPVLS